LKLTAILFCITVTLMIMLMFTSIVVLGQVEQLNVDSKTNVTTEMASGTASMVAAQVCQKGFSGQVIEGGFSITNADGFCDLIRLSDVMFAASEAQRKLGNDKYADMYMGYYHTALDDANNLIQRTSYTTYLDRVFGDLLLPILIIVGLVLLL
jgi:hypothetical protein